MTVDIDHVDPPTSRQEVLDIEASLDVSFPDEYRDFIINHNGAGLAPNRFTQDGINYGLNSFIKLIDIPFQRNSLKEINDIDLIPFALDGSGNYFCFGERTNMNSIHFVDHEIPGADAARKVASSFSKLLESLQPFQKKELSLLPEQVISSWVNPKLRDKLRG